MRIEFDRPEFLWLLMLLPVIWWIGSARLQLLGRFRGILALVMRSLVVVSIVMALAGIQWSWTSDRVSVMYLLDQSESIAPRRRQAMFEFVTQSVRRHRNETRHDLAGVIVFGGRPAIEVPPDPGYLPDLSSSNRLPIRADATNLQRALELAMASMPADTCRRMVLVSDGNETNGHAEQIAATVGAMGIGIDVVPVTPAVGADVVVEKIDLPPNVRRGQILDARVVMTHFAALADDGVNGQLRIVRSGGRGDELLLEQTVSVQPGKNVFPIKHAIEHDGAYRYTARFVPHDRQADSRPQNNQSVGFTKVDGQGRVLLIASEGQHQQWDRLANLLREDQIEVVVQSSHQALNSITSLQNYDAVILADLPRVSGESENSIVRITDAQIKMLARHTQQLGAGLLMIGGPNAFGAGGWSGSELEAAMPVDFEVKNKRAAAVGALSIVLDRSGSMQGPKMQLCQSAAREAIAMLGPTDLIEILTFDSRTHEIIPMQAVTQPRHLQSLVSSIQSGGGTDLYPAMQHAYRSLSRCEASVKHLIVLSDGQTQPNQFDSLASKMKHAGITVSCVAIGHGADAELMRRIASRGQGKFYRVLSPQAIPSIVMRESRRVAQPLIYEREQGLQPNVSVPHALLMGIDPPPAITGYVMTTAKQNPLVQVLLDAPGPQQISQPLLAVWQYGLGRAAVLTTDGGQRWASDWNDWAEQPAFFRQLVRWLMRPSGTNDHFTLATVVKDDRVEVVVSATDVAAENLNFVEIQASVLSPDLTPIPLQLKQTAPGRYLGHFPLSQPGSYLVNVVPGSASAPLVAGVWSVADAEYRFRQTNQTLLEQLSATVPQGGQAGELAAPLDTSLQGSLQNNPFRDGLNTTGSLRDVWPLWVCWASGLFLLDILLRRIATPFKTILDQNRASRSVPVAAQTTSGPIAVAGADLGATRRSSGSPRELSYTERLLQAKQRSRPDS
ncbi:VWA domain-containing protein [Stieleria sp. TO1_6]|uniref:VWA domain-containing protein n=1 Tax=Stieleria tagensis TaxID=2956795 RepID=UPI00209ACA8E|nr:VWA domain-containing protein [Stieleria tagensis]MCO8125120.1 VWA domain-containing protein [Stieleria tagensis]